MDIKAIRDGLKDRLDTIDGLRVHDTLPDVINPPAAVIFPDEPFIAPNEAFGKGLAEARFRVLLYVQRVSARGAQDALDEYLSGGTGETRSLLDALEEDRTLDGVVSSLVVTGIGAYGSTTFGEGDNAVLYGSAELRVSVYARRV